MSNGDITLSIHLRFLALRSIERLSKNPVFLDSLNRCTPEEREELVKLIDACDADGVADWVKKIQNKNYEDMSLRDLRLLGRKLFVANVNILTRGQLLLEIHARRNSVVVRNDEEGNSTGEST